MLDVVAFLERLGSDASTRDAAPAEVERHLIEAGLGTALRTALVSGDRKEFERLLGAKSTVCCIIDPAVEDDEDDEARRKRECEGDAEEQPVPVRDPEKVASAG